MRCRDADSDCFLVWRPPDGTGARVLRLRQGTPHERYRCLVRIPQIPGPGLIHACTMAPVSTGPSALVRELANTAPDWPFRHAACRGGWHRLGGLIDAKGKRLTDNLEAGRKPGWRLAKVIWAGWPRTTPNKGCWPPGWWGAPIIWWRRLAMARRILQLEIEELRKSPATPCLPMANRPPRTNCSTRNCPPTAAVRWACRIMCSAASAMPAPLGARMRAKHPEPAPSTACWKTGRRAAPARPVFCNHWVLAMSEHQDRFLQSVFRAKPMSTLEGHPPAFHGEQARPTAPCAPR